MHALHIEMFPFGCSVFTCLIEYSSDRVGVSHPLRVTDIETVC